MEYQIVYFFNHLGQRTIIDNLTKFISLIHVMIVFWLILIVLCLIFDQKNGKWIFGGAVLICLIYFLINDYLIKKTILEHFYFRERPYLAYPYQIVARGDLWRDSSFPSGHMAFTAALTTLFLYFYRKWWAWGLAILIVLSMSFARMHNGMHYPSDILIGIVFGILEGWLAIYLILILKKFWTKHKRSKS